jgi:hypothetical protein
MSAKSYSPYLNFNEISKKWEEEAQKKYGSQKSHKAMTKEQIAFMLIWEAANGDFEFLLPSDLAKDKKYVSELYEDMTGKRRYKTKDIKEQLQQLIDKLPKPPIGSYYYRGYFREKYQSLLGEAYSQLASKIYIHSTFFLRWCRVSGLDLTVFSLQKYEKGKGQYYSVIPTFWGNPWKDKLPDYFEVAQNNKEYSLSDAAKFLLDPELWGDYVRWFTVNGCKDSSQISANRYNMYVEAQERLETYLLEGKLVLRGYEDDAAMRDTPQIISSDKISKMKFKYQDSSATFGKNIVIHLNIIIKPVMELKNAGRNKKAVYPFIVSELDKVKHLLQAKQTSAYKVAQNLFPKQEKMTDAYQSEKDLRSVIYRWCKENGISLQKIKKNKSGL